MLRIFADLDGTICESRQIISREMKERLSKFDLVVISGAEKKQMLYQLDGLKCIVMGQSGNETDDWQNVLTKEEKEEVYQHLDKIAQAFPEYIDNYYEHFWAMDDLVEDRGCQISLSFIGHHADREEKRNFDGNKKIRKNILKRVPFKSENLEVRIAGTTCLDYTKKGFNKGANIQRYIDLHKLDKKDCVYFGDALFKGGNDESVKGVIKCVEVANPQDLLSKLLKYE